MRTAPPLPALALLAACAGGAPKTPVDSGPADPADSGPGADGGADGAVDDGPLPLCINEFMPGNEASLTLYGGAHPDWIELHNPTAAPVSLDGWTISPTEDGVGAHTFDARVAVPAGGFVLLQADGLVDEGPRHLPFALAQEGGSITLTAPDGRGLRVRYGDIEDDFAAARATDCCEGEGCFTFVFQGTPGYSNTGDGPPTEQPVPAASTWRYWDGGSLPAADWTSPTYDDREWPAGPAPLGFGDAHIATAVNGGPDGARHISTWLRHSFTLSDAAGVSEARLRVLYDDGVVVYLNGSEAARLNLPDGELAAGTLALSSIGGDAEITPTEVEIDPGLLVDGVNQLAIDLRQASPGSSDLGVAMEVEVVRR